MTSRPSPPDGAARRRPVRPVPAALAVALVAAAVAVWWTQPLSDHVDLVDASVETLDTVAVDGRRVVASFGGTVTDVDSDGTLWVGTGERAFAVRGAAAESLRVADRVLVVGRLRADRTGRWLDAGALTVVRTEAFVGPRRSGEQVTVQPDD